jgi:hypothetical protein
MACAGRASRKEVRRWVSAGATRGAWGSGEADGGLGRRGTTACDGTAARQRGTEEEEGGGLGADL